MISVYISRLVMVVSIVMAVSVLTSLDGFAQGEVINACFANSNGSLRIVLDPNQCKNSETPVTLVTGLVGPPGGSGLTGYMVVSSELEIAIMRAGEEADFSVICDEDDPNIVVLGGGCSVVSPNDGEDINIFASEPVQEGVFALRSWHCAFVIGGSATLEDVVLKASATCAENSSG